MKMAKIAYSPTDNGCAIAPERGPKLLSAWWRRFTVFTVLAMLSALAPGQASLANDGANNRPAAEAQKDRPWQFGLRGIVMSMQSNVNAATNGPSGILRSSTQSSPQLYATWEFARNVSIEVTMANPKALSFSAAAIALETGGGTYDLGLVKMWPVTFILRYHLPKIGAVRPYIGAGGNYIFYYEHRVPTATGDDISFNDNLGFAFQVGADLRVSSRWTFNIDVKKQFNRTDIEITPIGAGENDPSWDLDVDIDPWAFGMGFAYSL
jgi:outer membrane protein